MENPFTTLFEKLDRIEKRLENLNLNQSELEKKELPDDLILIDEVEKITKYKKGYLYELARKNEIPCYRSEKGRGLRFSRRELESWIRAGRPSIISATIKSLQKI